MAFVAQPNTPPDHCVRFAPAVADDYDTRYPAARYHFAGAGLSPAGMRQLLGRTISAITEGAGKPS